MKKRKFINKKRLNDRKKKTIFRLLKYFFTGAVAVSIDLIILTLLTGVLSLYYLYAVSISFMISITISYIINKNWGFRDGKRMAKVGYPLFLIFSAIGLILTVSLMYFFVDVIGLYYIFSRIIVALAVGCITFILHSFFTFKTIERFADLY